MVKIANDLSKNNVTDDQKKNKVINKCEMKAKRRIRKKSKNRGCNVLKLLNSTTEQTSNSAATTSASSMQTQMDNAALKEMQKKIRQKIRKARKRIRKTLANKQREADEKNIGVRNRRINSGPRMVLRSHISRKQKLQEQKLEELKLQLQELLAKNKNDDDDDGDDCICIEKTIEQIIIDDDDTPSVSNCQNVPPIVDNTIDDDDDDEDTPSGSNCQNVPPIVDNTIDDDDDTPSGSNCQNVPPIVDNNIITSTPLVENSKSNDSLSFERTIFIDLTSEVKDNSLPSISNECNVATDVPASTAKDAQNNTQMPADNTADESVIFVSETIAASNSLPDFIPLESPDVPNPISMPATITPKRTQSRPALFTRSEKKQLAIYNQNAYNPNANENASLSSQSRKRMVLIDGSNVAYAHSNNRGFSAKGLSICLDYFLKQGHEVKAVVPQHRLRFNQTSNSELMHKLHSEQKLVITPSKNLPGLQSCSYDDRFILQLACELDAAIVSNDNYRDLIHESGPLKKIIENRVIGYTWCNDIFILPKDPYGKWGPTLDQILKT